eukprot:1605822-Amphidinium_carterae.3
MKDVQQWRGRAAANLTWDAQSARYGRAVAANTVGRRSHGASPSQPCQNHNLLGPMDTGWSSLDNDHCKFKTV